MSGLAGIGNVDVSQLLVTPTGGASPTRLGDLAANTLPLTGGTLTGALTLAADPAMSLQSATKRYVDAQIATALPMTGGTLSGALALTADPTTALQAATKQYVDGQVAAAVPKDWRARSPARCCWQPIRRVRCRRQPSNTSIRAYRAPATH